MRAKKTLCLAARAATAFAWRHALVYCGALAVLGVSQAQAGILELRITSPDPITAMMRTLSVRDGDVGDQNALPNAINIDESLLTAFFPELDSGSAVNLSSNFGTAEAFRRLTQATTFIRSQFATPVDVGYTIMGSQTDFLLPLGPTRVVTETTSGGFNNAPSNNSITFEGGVDTGNNLFTITTSAGVLGPFHSTSMFPNSFSGNGGPIFFSDNDMYSITVDSMIFSSANAEIQATNTVRIDALPAPIPEPSSLTLMSLGGIGLVVGTVRRRLKKRAA